MKEYPFIGKKLMTPGPVPMPADVKESLATLECHHRNKDFESILKRVFEDLPKIFQTSQQTCLLPCTGSGGLEAVITNCLTKDKPALFINAGKFGERWGKIAKAFGLPFEEVVMEWGDEVDLGLIEEKLKTGNYQALAWQACETSSGALLPTQELSSLCNKYGALSLVDGITALGAVDIPMDEWGIDAMVGGSQKAFMLPAGMAFVSLSKKAEAVTPASPLYYFDLKAERKSNLSGKTRFSTPTQFVIGLDIVLDEIFEKGFKNHLAEIAGKAEIFREKVNLPLFPKTSSPSLTCLAMPEGQSSNAVKKAVDKDGFIIMGGQGRLDDKILRVGHMGDISTEDLIQTAEAINRHL